MYMFTHSNHMRIVIDVEISLFKVKVGRAFKGIGSKSCISNMVERGSY